MTDVQPGTASSISVHSLRCFLTSINVLQLLKCFETFFLLLCALTCYQFQFHQPVLGSANSITFVVISGLGMTASRFSMLYLRCIIVHVLLSAMLHSCHSIFPAIHTMSMNLFVSIFANSLPIIVTSLHSS